MDPFPLLSSPTHHAIYRNLGCGLFFAEPVAAAERAGLEALVPPPLRHELVWTRDFLYAGSDDWFEIDLRIAYDPTIAAWFADSGLAPRDRDRAARLMARFDNEPRPAEYAAFSAAIDGWLRATHARAPLAFVYATDLPEFDAYPPWAARSIARVPETVVPWLTARWTRGGLGPGGPEHHAAVVLDNFSYFILTQYVQRTPDLSPPLRARLVQLAELVCASDTGCGAELWRSELLDRL